LIYEFTRRRRLQDADAADVTQEALQAVHGSIGRLQYDTDRGSFRGWLFTLVHRKLCDFLNRRRRHPTGGAEGLEEAAAPQEDIWNREYEQRLFRWGVDRVRKEFSPATWQAFWLTAVDGCDARTVAAQLGQSLGTVYVSKSRVLARLKELIREATQE
jgi:RNA polymerase sigma-70 factor (ECF subfamily)